MLGLQRAERPARVRKGVNVWALNKEPRLKSLLLVLADYLGDADWTVDTSFRTSREAVYLMHRHEWELRAYLHLHGQAPGRVGLHLEYPAVEGSGSIYEAFDNLSLTQVIDMLAAHFGISQLRYPQSSGD